jgi:hypothetical protein
MRAAAFSGRQVTTVWLLHQLGHDYATQEGLTPEQAWELSEPRQRAELFNPVETQINPNQVDDAVAKWERLAGREGACVAVMRPAAPWTGPDQPVSEQPDPALPPLDRLLAGPCRPDWFPPPSVAPASPHWRALLRDHITFEHGLGAELIDSVRDSQLLQEHDLDRWENPYEDHTHG